MTNVSISMMVSDDTRDEVVGIVRGTIGPTRTTAGVTSCGLYGDLDDDRKLVLLVRCESRPVLNAYLQSRDFRSILIALDLLESPPEIRFDEVISSEGMEAVSALYGTTGAIGS